MKQTPIVPLPFKGAIFGMNGTLFDTEQWFTQAWWALLARRGKRYQDYNPALHEGLSNWSYFQTVMECFGIVESEATFAEEWRQEARRLVRGRAKLCPGIRPVLKGLWKQGIKMAVVTGSSTEMTQFLLMKHDIAKWFQLIVTREVLARHHLLGKPAPDPYSAAAHFLNLMAGHCIAFEDSVNGVISAKHAKCRTIIGVVNYPAEKASEVGRKQNLLRSCGAHFSFATLEAFRVQDHFNSL